MTTMTTSLEQMKRAALLKRLQQKRPADARAERPAPVPADRSRPLPLSWAQQRLWFLAQFDPAASRAYHMPAGLRLEGKLDRPALRATLDTIVARHEVLRTRFASIGGEAAQVIAPPDAGFALAEHDLGALAGQQQADMLARLAQEEAGAPFDLEAGPLVRGRLLRLAEDTHVLLVTQHHIVSDGWSIGLLIQEMSALYAAFSQGLPDPLPALAIQYADYAAWQRQWLQGEALQAQQEFWRAHLDGAPALLELPTDRPRPAVRSHAGAAVPVVLPEALASGLRQLSQRHGATLFMTLLAGWSALMSRLSGQDEVVTGTPVANRRHKELEPLLGFFVNTLALRVKLGTNPSTAQLIEQVKASTLQAYAHQDLPFEQVVEALQPTRTLSYSPLFQVMLTLNNTPDRGPLLLPGLSLSPLESAHPAVHFDLSLQLTETGKAITGTLEYATALFDHASAERIVGYLKTLLTAIVAMPDEPIGTLPLLEPAQREQLLDTFNATARAFPRDRMLHQLFEDQARRQPQATALVYEGDSLSYDELNRKANRLAHRLIALGVRPDQRVAICAERGLDMVAGLLGILKAGGAYVPLDPAHPPQRLDYMLADCAPVALLTQASLRERLACPADVDVLLLEEDPLAAAWPDTDPDPADLDLASRHLAYVIYTSGSTGMPKGVMVEHRHVVNLVEDWRQRFAEPASPRPASAALWTSIGFDVSLFELFVAFGFGSALHVVPDTLRADAPAVVAWLSRRRIELAYLPPFVVRHLHTAPDHVVAALALKQVLVGVEPLAEDELYRLRRLLPAMSIVNGYGPTEAAVYCTTYTEIRDARRNVPIGRPIANARVYILDAHRQPVPLGVIGELYIGGAGVARGYLNRPQLSAERFLDDPFGGAGERMYKTGDLARWLPDGNLEYIGRNDFQVKIRGFRIELGEIEARLAACPGVREAVVIAREDSPGEKRLVAYLIAAEGAAPAPAELRAALAASLPEHMLPAAFVSLAAFPLTTNGKLDRDALPVPDGDAVAVRAYEAPQGEVETAIARFLQDLLRIERVGRHDHFFELGGHSLAALRLVAHLRETLGIELALRDIFTHPILRELAQVVGRSAQAALPSILPADRNAPLQLSWAQQRLWFLARFDPAASRAYHMPAGLRLEGKLDRAALRATLDTIVARHEVLRTRFASAGDEPVQVIAPPDAGFALAEHDLRALGDEEQAAMLARLAQEEAGAPFDLETGPLIRGRLLRLAEDAHVLLVTQHHIVSDGWSIGLLIQEMSALYAAFSQGLPDPLPALAIQYADYAAWQRQWLQGEALQAQQEFWRAHLDGAPALLELPTDRPRPAVRRHEGAAVPVVLPEALASGLRQLSQRHGATLFMTLLAGWSALMSRLSGQDEVVTGTPVANRRHKELEPLLGFFVNTLALRVKLGANPSTAQLIEQVKASTLQAYAHQDLPFEQVVEAVQPARTLSYSPLFQAVLSLNNTPDRGPLLLPGLTLSPADAGAATGAVEVDLNLQLTDTGKAIHGTLEYASALFDQATVERLAGHFITLLGAMVAAPDMPVGTLPLLGQAQRVQLLESFNDTARPFPRDRLLHELFEEQAARRPQAPALRFGQRSLTYDELNRCANRLAHHLLALGVKPDDRVAICVERGIEMVVGLLAILKAGGAYVPLDPAYPEERLKYMIDDCAPAALLTLSGLRSKRPGLQHCPAPLVLLDEAAGADRNMQAWPDTDPLAQSIGLSPGHLAYVIYTSGSTGMPKGVMVEHRGLVNLAQAQCGVFGVNADSRVLQFASFSFDASVSEVAIALSCGACLCLGTPEELRPGTSLFDTLRGHQVSHVTLPSSVALATPGIDTLAGMTVILAGEPAAPALVHEWEGHVNVINAYGPTEATVCATAFDCRGHLAGRIPIGKPIDNVRVYILDAHRQPVPLGVVGELYVGGVGVARGYLNRPELSAERFLDDPFGGAGERMYKTGDLARWLPNGNLEYIGRNDFQVKIRGFRIELGEIEARLAACPGVREAVVIAREDSPGEKRLVAYLIAAEGAAPAPAELRAALAASLPEHMLPAAFVTLPAFPLTPNGKLDRNALPVPDGEAVATRGYEAPQGKVETAIAELWQQLLGIERVGRKDHFFELGGHSLLAVRVCARLEHMFSVELPLRELFARPTVRELARFLEGAAHAPLTVIERVDRGATLALSWSQQRLWFLEQLDPAAGLAYLIPFGVRLKGKLNPDTLRAVLDTIVARHEVLRTSFLSVGGQPCLVIAERPVPFPLAMHDLRGMAAPDQQGELARLGRQEAGTPFDLAAGPLIRGRLARVADDEHVLFITQHHIVSDGWSMGLLITEIATLYAAFSNGQPDPLPAPDLQYVDYANWQRGWLQGEALERQLDFWRDHLNAAPTLLDLPTDRPRPAVQSHAGASVPLVLSAEVTAGLHRLGERHGTTLFMTLLAGWAVLLARLSGQHDIVIGTPVANRRRTELESMLGFFVNTLALRVRLDEEPTVGDLLAQVRDNTLAAFNHQDLPFEQVVELVNPPRSLAHSPLFQAMLSLNNTPSAAATLPELALAPVEDSRRTTHYDLSVSLMEHDGQLSGNIDYATDLFDESTITRWAAHFATLLSAMVDDDGRRVGRLPLLSPVEQARLLESPADGDYAGADRKLMHQLFEEQAARTPHEIALVSGSLELTYDELNRRANRLAHRLLALGVRPDTRVAICVERSPEMIVGLLAILKAGGAYVPLDPSYPRDRLAYVLEDSAPQAILTNRRCAALCDGHNEMLMLESAETGDWPDTNPALAALTPDHLAYIIYTSGSTGLPKGVMTEHGAVIAGLFWAQAKFDMGPGTAILQKAAFGFDVSVWEIFISLSSGAKLVLLPPDANHDPAIIVDTINRHGVTVVQFVPSAMQALLDYRLPPGAMPSLRHVLLSGEALSQAFLGAVSQLLPGVALHNIYGPTEAAVHATWWLYDLDYTDTKIPIGRPFGGARIYILDAHGQPVPPGVSGELYIAGRSVARGYRNRAELTADRFPADPFVPGSRMYKTGDLARWLADGNIEYMGRNDFQVKLRGFRIELGEIEARLAACPGIREAVVLAREDKPGDKRLVAYLLPEDGSTPVPADLRTALAAALPEYMVPAAFVTLPVFPLTPNGKLDRRALPAPEADMLGDRPYEAPQGLVETAIAQIWAELLGVERVSRHDHFFELGGHSLLAVQLAARLRDHLKIEVRLRDLFGRTSLAEFAASISTRTDDPTSGVLIPVRAVGKLPPLFVVHPVSGESSYVRELLPHLDPDLPVYALEAQGLWDATADSLDTVPAMAEAYLRAIRMVQPHGPYRLSGWSAGGAIAYEIAHQLISADETVEYVGLFDTLHHAELQRRYGHLPELDQRMTVLHLLESKISLSQFKQFEEQTRGMDIKQLVGFVLQSGYLPSDLDQELVLRQIKVRTDIGRASRNYRAPSISAPVVLYKATEDTYPDGDPTHGWKSLLGAGLTCRPIGGNHTSIMAPPNIAQLGAAISRDLAAKTAQATSHPEEHYSPVIMIQKGRSTTPPVLCIPGAGASVSAFCDFASALGADTPLYGLQARGLEGRLVPHLNAVVMARNYLQAIEQLAPAGPLTLVGHSFGGWVAFELACRLQERGRDVAQLILLDTSAPTRTQGSKRLHRIDVLMKLVGVYELEPMVRLGLSASDFEGLDQHSQLELLLSRLVDNAVFPGKTSLQSLYGIVRVFEANVTSDYMPSSRYQGTLHLVTAVDTVDSLTDEPLETGKSSARAWSSHATHLVTHRSTGNHLSLLKRAHLVPLVDELFQPALG